MSRSLCFNSQNEQICLQVTPLAEAVLQTQASIISGNPQQLRTFFNNVVRECRVIGRDYPLLEQDISSYRTNFERALELGNLPQAAQEIDNLRNECIILQTPVPRF